jgi:hypothetical protein
MHPYISEFDKCQFPRDSFKGLLPLERIYVIHEQELVMDSLRKLAPIAKNDTVCFLLAA